MKRSLALLTVLCLSTVFETSTAWSKKVEIRKVQEVNFDAVDVDGQVRNPDGAYVVQKRVVEFLPLYKVRRNFDESIKESVEYVK